MRGVGALYHYKDLHKAVKVPTRYNVLGIDPGKYGAVALVNHQETLIAYRSFYTTDERVESAQVGAIHNVISITDGPIIAFIEDVHAMPRQGVVSMFTFGTMKGIAIGALLSMNIQVVLIPPQGWRIATGCIGLNKKAVISKFTNIYGKNNIATKNVAILSGISDAFFIAIAGVRLLRQIE